MPRKYLSRWLLPTRKWLIHNRWLKPIAPLITARALWRLAPHSVGGGVFVGAFAGLIPGPFQVISAILFALIFRVNLPVSVAFTFYSNPITIVPLYLLALKIGTTFLPSSLSTVPDFPALTNWHILTWCEEVLSWFGHLGWPFVVGLLVLAATIGTVGYFLVQLIWRVDVSRRLKKRRNRQTEELQVREEF
ncbi:DUF2062 domain-containing protein [Leeia sp. TBRC 13508]|uniref:DUF2062 domain-containing protein n=1 Tax=Leeia speluncae TaxID=2884804 RepID=A0ABS8D2T7_9NEIS|nr:DUF2062 domain-containing protein [Leeia speluncae]MCB6182499.1 DUF2062 domain-containing protein [Leeia speluncae]